MWRKQLHEEYGYFDAAMKVAGDYEFFLRVSQTHNFMLIPELLGLYYYNPNSLERSAGTHEEEKQFTINLYDRFSSYNVRRPLPFPKPQFSVILRNENQGQRMEESIRAVLAQTRGDWELIIVDEASMDDSLAIIRRYCNDPRIRLIRHNCKAFPADVAKEAIAAVNADLFGAINSGDVLSPDAIEQVVDAHERSPQNAWISFPQAHGLATGPFKSWKLREYINGKIQTPQRNQNSDDNVGSLAGRAVNLPIRKANPLVSVYMGAYNTQTYIRQAIESVLSQTFRDFELIVVDDGSTDRTVDVVESFKDSRIRLLRQEHKNFAAAMNTAISHARGEWIIGVDSDDDIEPDYLERMAGYALANPGFDYYYPASLFLNDPQKQYSQDRWDYRDFEDNRNLPTFLLMNGFSPIPNAGSLKRKTMFAKTGLYRQLDAVEDFDFLTRNALKIRFKRADGIAGYHYRINPAGNCHKFVRRSQVTAEVLDEMTRAYDSQVLCPPLAKIEPHEKEKKYRQYLLNVFQGLANRYSGRGGEVFSQYAQKYRTQSVKNQVQQACI